MAVTVSWSRDIFRNQPRHPDESQQVKFREPGGSPPAPGGGASNSSTPQREERGGGDYDGQPSPPGPTEREFVSPPTEDSKRSAGGLRARAAGGSGDRGRGRGAPRAAADDLDSPLTVLTGAGTTGETLNYSSSEGGELSSSAESSRATPQRSLSPGAPPSGSGRTPSSHRKGGRRG
jgi:hypothetical protein